ncbi:MAG: aminotransferase class IV [Gemmataceae bacterium]
MSFQTNREPIASVQGQIVPLSQAMVPALDRGYLFADAVYEVLRTYKGRTFLAKGHFRRLERSLATIRIEGVDLDGLKKRIQSVIREGDFDEALVYIQISRGVAPRAHGFPEGVKPFEFFYVADYVDTAAPLRESGVAVSLQPDIRWGRCDTKSTNLLGNVLAYQDAKNQGAYEAILYKEDGTVTEMTRTSFFAVKDNIIWTHPAGHRILPSITKDLVFELCEKIGQPIRAHSIPLKDLMKFDEMFMAGTTTEIIPILSVDGKPVGNGTVGPVTIALRKAFLDYLNHWLSHPDEDVDGDFSD